VFPGKRFEKQPFLSNSCGIGGRRGVNETKLDVSQGSRVVMAGKKQGAGIDAGPLFVHSVFPI
jgi:hypothetical protein